LLHSIEDFRLDPRENIARLSIIWFIAEKLKINPHQLFDLTSTISSTDASQYLQEFKNRSKQLKSLNAIGLIAKEKRAKQLFYPNLLLGKSPDEFQLL
jgi:hypothetical protein